ncbi:RNA polymerase II-associated protein [Pluteus cervinus]|uniref:RNA polymerase II-associated protein n=1 Tax=Pluteus cervinus TaxID=181527 RepID=A0ACD3B8X6_9AGAR|nr:RNA polymerase II-associated protein [Pluteus cervinus]
MDDTSVPGRSVDIELGGQEVIAIDLDNLDPNPEDVLDLLKEGRCKVWVWTKLAGEYWRRGYLDAAEKIAFAAIESFTVNGSPGVLSPIYSLLANIQFTHARTAPKLVWPDARADKLANTKTKGEYYTSAAQHINTGDRTAADASETVGTTVAFLTRGIYQLSMRSWDDARRSFQGVLDQKPTNIAALLGKARAAYGDKNYRDALKIYQEVLRYSPNCLPDPRVGIGLCLWSMDQKEKAKAAWERSLEVNPSEWPARLLLGIEAINASKNDDLTEEERYSQRKRGTEMVGEAFKANKHSAAAANVLSDLFLQRQEYSKSMKLAERTIQFADTVSLLIEGFIRAGRVSHAEGSVSRAFRCYRSAMDPTPTSSSTNPIKSVVAAVGLAQTQMKNDEIPAALHTLDTLLQPPNPHRTLEATLLLASLRATPRQGLPSSEFAREKTKAKESYDRISKLIEQDDSRPGQIQVPDRISKDMQTYAEIARLWQGENNDKVIKALKEALRICDPNNSNYPRILNNLGALHQMEGNFTEAQTYYQSALTSATSHEAGTPSISISICYNLARVYEDQGQESNARDAYTLLLSKHPEYVDAKIRLAHLAFAAHQTSEASDLLKQCLASQPSNLNLRAYLIHFLFSSNQAKQIKEVVYTSLKDYDRHDVYSLCASGWFWYYTARESKEQHSEERKKNFLRSAEYYEKALQLDPNCAFAAQGLAIMIAEDALGTLWGALGPPTPDDVLRRDKSSREALDIFAKVRESISDGSVYVNMGHCYYARDEYDRAIECYETASTRFYDKRNVSVLMYLCRSWYAKAIKDQSYPSMNTALQYVREAQTLHPSDKATTYNIAMIQQKSAEMLFAMKPANRTLKDLQQVIENANDAQRLFGQLAADTSDHLPYPPDLADQRRRYGEGMLRKAEDHLSAQRQHEDEVHAKLDAARRKRQEEKERIEELERRRLEELRLEEEKLAEERRMAMEQTREWTRDMKMESDEEKEKKPKKSRKPRSEPASGDEGEPKKRRRKIKRQEEGSPMFSEEDGDEKPVKKRVSKKRVVRDDDEEEVTGPRKRQIKSKAMLSDTDDEDMA